MVSKRWNELKYRNLWLDPKKDNSLSFWVVGVEVETLYDILLQNEYGRIIANSWEEAEQLLSHQINKQIYPANSQLVMELNVVEE